MKLPESMMKYKKMSKRQRWQEIRSTIWYTPGIYILLSICLAVLTLYLDLGLELSQYIDAKFSSQAQLTRMLVSTLIGGILTLSAFTFNSLLVVLTTFSGQFSPRMLLNFVADKKTQHVLGIFNGSFIYVLTVFLFISNNNSEQYFAVPITTVFLALFAAVTFIYFINHATTWMQVHNITYNMKNISKKIITFSLLKEIEPYRIKENTKLDDKEYPKDGHRIVSHESGYIQLVDFSKLIDLAKRDNLVVRFEYGIGEHVLSGAPILTYWKEKDTAINELEYLNTLEIGHKQTEIQDLEFGVNKLSEIAIKALGNNDPKTAANTIHQMSELLQTIAKMTRFSPFLVDEEKNIRVILKEEDFEFYLYRGFGYIRHYADDNWIIITDIISSLATMAESMDDQFHDDLWNFAIQTAKGVATHEIYNLDRKYLLQQLSDLATATNRENEYRKIEQEYLMES
ncbi:DUF2254 domain-containing protein [Bacillus sp. Marseille-Q3570]|uniref:DUF2254 domain-containing protein n=1 Tax=Bacillus sp. Marseille-Q3570 TaxID=2963522 RepID=UPI0021B71B9E|nr:DUF2254 domain-containing protein [Bacillus sp. Marseille-Q3570]